MMSINHCFNHGAPWLLDADSTCSICDRNKLGPSKNEIKLTAKIKSLEAQLSNALRVIEDLEASNRRILQIARNGPQVKEVIATNGDHHELLQIINIHNGQGGLVIEVVK